MPLDKAGLIVALTNMITANSADPTVTPIAAATQLADAIDTFVKSGSVTVTVTSVTLVQPGVGVSGPGTGTGTIA